MSEDELSAREIIERVDVFPEQCPRCENKSLRLNVFRVKGQLKGKISCLRCGYVLRRFKRGPLGFITEGKEVKISEHP